MASQSASPQPSSILMGPDTGAGMNTLAPADNTNHQSVSSMPPQTPRGRNKTYSTTLSPFYQQRVQFLQDEQQTKVGE